MTKRGILLAGLFGIALAGCSESPKRQAPFKVVVLGFEGVDPDLVDSWLEELPNLRKLSNDGTLGRLATTSPPDPAVAWSSLATGVNPGGHGVFGLLTREAGSYLPQFGLSQVHPATTVLGVPFGGASIRYNLAATPYWEHFDKAGYATVNLRVPFLSEGLQHGKTLAGLGLPALDSPWGSYTYLASDLSQWDPPVTELGGRQIALRLEERRATAELTNLVGDWAGGETPTVTLEVELDSEASQVSLGLQDQQQTVLEGQWSDWFQFDFSMGAFYGVRGVSRFHVLETFPEVRLYLEPLGPDPRDPVWPLTDPPKFSRTLADSHGIFPTVGWGDEIWAAAEEQIPDELFLAELLQNMETLKAMLFGAIDGEDAAVYTAIFSGTGSASHLFYRLMDPEHPRYEQRMVEQYGDSIQRVYQKMDSIIGETLNRLGPEDWLVVLSDHGFHSWRKEFNTNRWLVDNGYLFLKDQTEEEEISETAVFNTGQALVNVDWSRTQAYALGLSQIYVNLRGREPNGIVQDGEEYRLLVEEIRGKLNQYLDPDTGETALASARAGRELYAGPAAQGAADIVIGFKEGYRTSWSSAFGGVSDNILLANLSKWSGDHFSSDAASTEGFLALNRKIETSGARLVDIAPSLYRLLKVEPPEGLDGEPIFD